MFISVSSSGPTLTVTIVVYLKGTLFTYINKMLHYASLLLFIPDDDIAKLFSTKPPLFLNFIEN